MSTDKRAFSEEKITAPAPLPYISRRALKRVKDRIAPPTECRYCGGPVRIATHDEVYGRAYNDWPFMYRCDNCDAHVGLHPNTDLPLGILANSRLRSIKATCKRDFLDMSERCCFGDRNAAYKWLAKAMSIPRNECHWGLFEVDQCLEAARLCAERPAPSTREKMLQLKKHFRGEA